MILLCATELAAEAKICAAELVPQVKSTASLYSKVQSTPEGLPIVAQRYSAGKAQGKRSQSRRDDRSSPVLSALQSDARGTHFSLQLVVPKARSLPDRSKLVKCEVNAISSQIIDYLIRKSPPKP
jgi:hypothetical protein